MVIGTAVSVASQPSALCVRVFALDIILGKFSLAISQSGWSTALSNSVFFGFSVFQTKKSPLVSVRSVTACQKCNSYNSIWITVCYACYACYGKYSKNKNIFCCPKKTLYVPLDKCIDYSQVKGVRLTIRVVPLTKTYRFEVQGSRYKGTKR